MECYGIAWNIMGNHGISIIIILGKHPWRLQDTDLGKETIQRLLGLTASGQSAVE